MGCLPSSVQCHWALLTLACTTALLVQLGLVFKGYVAPTLTNTRVEQQHLKHMDFPLICVEPGFDQKAIVAAGYLTSWEYFLGRNRFNSSILGWAGHTNTSGVQGSVTEILRRVGQHSIGEVFEYIEIWTMTDEPVKRIRVKTDYVTRSVNYPHNCYTLDLTNQTDVKEKMVNMLTIKFHNHTNYSVTILVEGSTLSCSRTFSANAFFSTGDTIKMRLGGASVSYNLKIEKNVFVEEDPTKRCLNYPNAKFSSYSTCTDKELKDKMASTYPGLVPIWLADNVDQVTAEWSSPLYPTAGTEKGELITIYILMNSPR
jgi:hypothetical protein